MDAHPVAWGLDIGHAAIKAVKLARSGSDVVVQGYVIEPIAQEGDRDQLLVAALRQLAAREEFGTTPVFASLSGKQVLSRTVNVPVLGTKDIGRIIELEARQQIPGDFNTIEWGYHLSPGNDGASYDVALFAVKRDALATLMQHTKAAGLNLVGVSPASLALYNFIRFDQEFPSDETVIVLDVGAQNTDLVFYQGDSLAIYSLDVSGNDITDAFVKKFRVSQIEAERLKREVADSRQADRILKVIEGTLGDLVGGVQRRIGFYKTQRPDAKLENLIISGNTFRMPGLPEYLAERLRYTINILEDLDRIHIAPGLPKDHFMNDLQGLGVALGLALQATGTAKAKVNLLPSAAQLERVLVTKRWAGIAAVALLGVGCVATWMIKSSRVESNSQMVTMIQAEMTAATKDQAIAEAQKGLNTVGEKGSELRQFSNVGDQQGVSTAITSAVLGLIEDAVQRHGPQADPEPDATRRSDSLAALYLSEYKLADYNVSANAFQPFAAARQVELTIHILDSEKAQEQRDDVLKRLRALPMPEPLLAVHPLGIAWKKAAAEATAKKEPLPPAPLLFSGVQLVFDGSEKDVRDYFYVDLHHIGATGNVEPLRLQRKFNGIRATFACALAEAKP